MNTDTDRSGTASPTRLLLKRKKKRRGFTKKEDMKIIEFIAHRNWHHRTQGSIIWQTIETLKVCPNHTWLSMRDRYLKHILPNFRSYNLNEELVQKIDGLNPAAAKKPSGQSSESVEIEVLDVRSSDTDFEAEGTESNNAESENMNEDFDVVILSDDSDSDEEYQQRKKELIAEYKSLLKEQKRKKRREKLSDLEEAVAKLRDIINTEDISSTDVTSSESTVASKCEENGSEMVVIATEEDETQDGCANNSPSYTMAELSHGQSDSLSFSTEPVDSLETGGQNETQDGGANNSPSYTMTELSHCQSDSLSFPTEPVDSLETDGQNETQIGCVNNSPSDTMAELSHGQSDSLSSLTEPVDSRETGEQNDAGKAESVIVIESDDSSSECINIEVSVQDICIDSDQILTSDIEVGREVPENTLQEEILSTSNLDAKDVKDVDVKDMVPKYTCGKQPFKRLDLLRSIVQNSGDPSSKILLDNCVPLEEYAPDSMWDIITRFDKNAVCCMESACLATWNTVDELIHHVEEAHNYDKRRKRVYACMLTESGEFVTILKTTINLIKKLRKKKAIKAEALVDGFPAETNITKEIEVQLAGIIGTKGNLVPDDDNVTCHLCMKNFPTEDSLNSHLASSHKHFLECNRGVETTPKHIKHDMDEYQAAVSTAIEFKECALCDYFVGTRNELVEHIKQMHSNFCTANK